MSRRLIVCALVATGCSADEVKSATSSPESGSATKKKGSGGFSASLSAELAKEGSMAAATGSATRSATGSATGSATRSATGSATGVIAIGSGSAKSSAGSAAGGSAAGGSAATPPPRPPEHRGPVKVPAELAAIKLDLEPNWDRDLDEAGTISLVVKVPPGNDTRLFTFHYSYDDPRAPVDRDQYVKWLADAKLMTVTTNRQRGAAWYLEGTDANGAASFRYLVNYGGKHLICFGSLYKDAASSALGDLRDRVLIQAKKICETLAL